MSDNVLICCFARLAATKRTFHRAAASQCVNLAPFLRICLEHISSEAPGQNEAKKKAAAHKDEHEGVAHFNGNILHKGHAAKKRRL